MIFGSKMMTIVHCEFKFHELLKILFVNQILEAWRILLACHAPNGLWGKAVCFHEQNSDLNSWRILLQSALLSTFRPETLKNNKDKNAAKWYRGRLLRIHLLLWSKFLRRAVQSIPKPSSFFRPKADDGFGYNYLTLLLTLFPLNEGWFNPLKVTPVLDGVERLKSALWPLLKNLVISL